MAGDWIKIEHALADKPEVWRMSAILGITPEAVVGHLVRVWAWADQQSKNVDESEDTRVDAPIDLVSSIARCANFANAMLEVRWLAQNGAELVFPGLQGFISETAKIRALRNRAQAKWKHRKAAASGDREVKEKTIKGRSAPGAQKERSKAKINGNGAHGPALSDTGIQALGVKLGIEARAGESMDAYRQRVLGEQRKRAGE